MTAAASDMRCGYCVEDNWAKLPEGWHLNDVAAVAVDGKDRVYVFNRGRRPMIIFNRDGEILDSWGEGLFNRPHGLHIGEDEMLYCTDDGDHTVRKCTTAGEVLLTIGSAGIPSQYMSGRPFHRCTHTALSRSGDIYVSDGYGNARIHKYSPDGQLLLSWGEPGTGPGQFNIPHNIVSDRDGWVYVADRENHRIQVFDKDGRFETQWHDLHRPCGLCFCSRLDRFIVGELPPQLAINRLHPNLGPRLSILDKKGRLIQRIGGENGPSTDKDGFIAPHSVAMDSRGDIYVGEVAFTLWPGLFPQVPVPDSLATLKKLVKI